VVVPDELVVEAKEGLPAARLHQVAMVGNQIALKRVG
jgi:hypothetical protein